MPTLKRLTGTGAAGIFVTGDKFKQTNHVTPLKEQIDLWMAGDLCRNRYVGGSMTYDLDATTTGTFDLKPWIPFGVDNRSNRLSGFSDANGAVLVVQVRFLVQVSDAGITVTPKVYDITAAALATTSGGVACSAIADDYAGTNQQQTLALTLPNAHHYFKPQVTIAGAGVATGEYVRATAVFDCYVALP